MFAWAKVSPMLGSDNPASLDGKLVIITGANSGIGKETAADLYKRGARVIMLCRSEEKANSAINSIKETMSNSNGTLSFEQCDMSSMSSVRKCAERLLEYVDKIDILVNNAGIVWDWGREVTDDGFELTFATNHLGPFLLTDLLVPLLKKSADSGFTPRIVNVASEAYLMGGNTWDDMNMEKSWGSQKAYGISKLANILHAKELARRLKEFGILAFSLHPGFVETEIFKKSGSGLFNGCCARIFISNVASTPLQGAQTTLFCCLDDSIIDKSGGYFLACRHTIPKKSLTSEKNAKRLWEESEKLLGITSQI